MPWFSPLPSFPECAQLATVVGCYARKMQVTKYLYKKVLTLVAYHQNHRPLSRDNRHRTCWPVDSQLCHIWFNCNVWLAILQVVAQESSKHFKTTGVIFFMGWIPLLTASQQCQRMDGNSYISNNWLVINF